MKNSSLSVEGGCAERNHVNCRHCHSEWTVEWEYCPQCQRNHDGAVYPETQTSQELEDIDALWKAIHKAFADVALEDGETIHEADREGVFFDEPRSHYREKDPETAWRDVPDWKLERFYSALNFFDLQGWRFYVPAYMCWTLKNWRSSDSPTVDWTIWSFVRFDDWSLTRYRTLNDEQNRVVFAFLDFFRRYSSA